MVIYKNLYSYINNFNKIIFTFWEPKEKIPGYLSLCIKTWKKFLPEYRIIILDYKKVKYYLGHKIYSSIIGDDMHVMVQSDAIRVAILNKYGGIWMDADNIIINGQIIKRFKDVDLGMIIEKEYKYPFIAFIYASKKSAILKEWLRQIIGNVKIHKEISKNKQNTDNWNKSWEEVTAWYYLGNGIINPLIKNTTKKQFLGIDQNEIGVFPELIYNKNFSLGFPEKYISFFFNKGDPHIVLNISKDLIFLQNSWTPFKYKQMTEDEFLKQDILLSKLLALLLNINIISFLQYKEKIL